MIKYILTIKLKYEIVWVRHKVYKLILQESTYIISGL